MSFLCFMLHWKGKIACLNDALENFFYDVGPFCTAWSLEVWKWAIMVVKPVLREYSLCKGHSSHNNGLCLVSLIQELPQRGGPVSLTKLLDCSGCDRNKQYPSGSPKLQESLVQAESPPILFVLCFLLHTDTLLSFPSVPTTYLTRGMSWVQQ